MTTTVPCDGPVLPVIVRPEPMSLPSRPEPLSVTLEAVAAVSSIATGLTVMETTAVLVEPEASVTV